jgi:hypothetical protein
MRNLLLSLAFLGLTLPTLGRPAAATPSHGAFSVPETGCAADQHPAIRWQKSLAAAKERAARTGKPLFLLHLFGKLDEPFC